MLRIVTLTRDQGNVALIEARKRRQDSRAKGLKDKTNLKVNEPLHTETQGALAEHAFAKFLGIPWVPKLGDYKKPDVLDWHVRSTKYPSGCLVIQEDDPIGKYVLIINNRTLKSCIVGWCHWDITKYMQLTRLTKSMKPAYCIPQDKLNYKF